ncbi:MAG: hypothetical protein QX192_01030 [Methylococcales bacterium]
MKKLTLFLLGLFCSNPTVAAPLEKVGGSCPNGYSTTGGNYCAPNNHARFAILKIGNSCPSGYSTSGSNYCLASSDNSKIAIHKQGSSCPSGYSTSGSVYCVSNKLRNFW